ncbi:Crp/Fnr family transcriptional regulator [Chitinophaga nivalis]|uniref:Crp/Fnr family transcriptional regulator n=1 Tax=Chitinophaga nivalis TaxID=2991709 RepID=A0ABT3INH2_9BACT|nr:Crp/Fnr family transcriptional regulator [Chitinophaga nivalis]MCW3464821.1 Crp/Fnr family transcriptional regulator [Chitinophaga nivalis]MCW3485488.1 Crp/Fnr family transcriptional regulator [Chitinophaga nivalis]
MRLPPQMVAIFSTIGPLTDAFLQDISQMMEPVYIPKKTQWLSNGKICRQALFLEEGLLYSSYEETKYTATTWFMKENEFVISVESFLRQKPSTETITALEDCVAAGLSYEHLKQLLTRHPCFQHIYTHLIEHYYIQSEKRAFNLRKREATDRYKFLLQHHAEIIQRVPLSLIASYLCINLETLSRIRSKI